MGLPVLLFAAWHVFYFRFYLHQSPENQILFRVYSWTKIVAITHDLFFLFGMTVFYGYIFLVFGASLLANVIFFRARGGRDYFVWIGILMAGFALMLLHFPAASVEFTIKRGYFKLLPVALFAMAEMRLWGWISEEMQRWEEGAVSGHNVGRQGPRPIR